MRRRALEGRDDLRPVRQLAADILLAGLHRRHVTGRTLVGRQDVQPVVQLAAHLRHADVHRQPMRRRALEGRDDLRPVWQLAADLLLAGLHRRHVTGRTLGGRDDVQAVVELAADLLRLRAAGVLHVPIAPLGAQLAERVGHQLHAHRLARLGRVRHPGRLGLAARRAAHHVRHAGIGLGRAAGVLHVPVAPLGARLAERVGRQLQPQRLARLGRVGQPDRFGLAARRAAHHVRHAGVGLAWAAGVLHVPVAILGAALADRVGHQLQAQRLARLGRVGHPRVLGLAARRIAHHLREAQRLVHRRRFVRRRRRSDLRRLRRADAGPQADRQHQRRPTDEHPHSRHTLVRHLALLFELLRRTHGHPSVRSAHRDANERARPRGRQALVSWPRASVHSAPPVASSRKVARHGRWTDSVSDTLILHFLRAENAI